MTPFHHIGNLVRDLMLQIPLPVVRGMILAVPIVLLIWVLRLPREVTTPPESTGRAGENLKYGAALALLIQIAIYSLL